MNIKLDLPDDFLREETRWDYTISTEMKKVWAVELDLLSEFDRVCRKHGLHYCAAGGTLIGAVRHKGMIPWDDDIDLVMPRKDYDRLLEIAETEFSDPYFFQTMDREPDILMCFAKLRNTSTTGIKKVHLPYDFKMNQGIFIDIFPLDNVPDSPLLNRLQYVHGNIYRAVYYLLGCAEAKKAPTAADRILKAVAKAANSKHGCKHTELKYSHKYEKVCRKYNRYDTRLVSMLTFNIINPRFRMYREDITDLMYSDFEFLKIPIPVQYDRNLKMMFGDYMKPVKNGQLHGSIIFDTEQPYTEYLNTH